MKKLENYPNRFENDLNLPGNYFNYRENFLIVKIFYLSF